MMNFYNFNYRPISPLQPWNQGWEQLNEDMVLEDLEYLQQMYPSNAKRYQTKINAVLDTLDYNGSMIYDQYPDKMQLERLTDSIIISIRNDSASDYENTSKASDNLQNMWLRELITVLLYYEILKRRRKKQNYYYF